MEIINLSKEQARELTYGIELEDFIVIDNILEDTSRWSLNYRLIIQRKSDGKYFADYYSVGATEIQDERPWEYSEPNFKEVKRVEKVVYDYV